MGKHSDVEALLTEEGRTFPAIIYRTDHRHKLHERNSEIKRLTSGHVGYEPGRSPQIFFLLYGVFRKYL